MNKITFGAIVYLLSTTFILYFILEKATFVLKAPVVLHDYVKNLQNMTTNLNQLRHLQINNMQFIILSWNFKKWRTPVFYKINMNNSLISKSCKVTNNRTLFNQSKAVVFFLDGELETKPPVDLYQRKTDQIWIFVHYEPACHTRRKYYSKYKAWHNVFNWSMGYRLKSDVYLPYGKIQRAKTLKHTNYSSIFLSKHKFAAWAVSHCKTQSEREKYVDILKKYVDVDIFGECGRHGRISKENLSSLLHKEYKFYLSFENAISQDYVTEKLFYYYQLDIITIFRGNLDDNFLFPKNTYIDTNEFSNISSLAKYLKFLSNNEKEYIGYLKRRDKYVVAVYGRDYRFPDSLSIVCDKLNQLKGSKIYYNNFTKWLGQCHEVLDLKER